MGHDAKHKSALIARAKTGDESAIQELEQRDWTKFLEKSVNNEKRKAGGGTRTPRTRQKAKGHSSTTQFVEWNDDTDQDDIIQSITHTDILVRRSLGSMQLPDLLVHVSRVDAFQFESTGLTVTVYTKDICPCRTANDNRETDFGRARTFRVTDIKEIRYLSAREMEQALRDLTRGLEVG